jgi:hypothetical protein
MLLFQTGRDVLRLAQNSRFVSVSPYQTCPSAIWPISSATLRRGSPISKPARNPFAMNCSGAASQG